MNMNECCIIERNLFGMTQVLLKIRTGLHGSILINCNCYQSMSFYGICLYFSVSQFNTFFPSSAVQKHVYILFRTILHTILHIKWMCKVHFYFCKISLAIFTKIEVYFDYFHSSLCGMREWKRGALRECKRNNKFPHPRTTKRSVRSVRAH